MSILYRNLVLIQFLFRSPGTVPAPPPLPSQQFGHNAQQPTLQQVIERQQQRQQPTTTTTTEHPSTKYF